MNPEIRFNPPPQEIKTPVENKVDRKPWNFKPVLWILAKVVLGVIALLAIVFLAKYLYSLKNHYFAETNTYSAVFLANGQVYFGKITDSNKSEITMTDVYYLQVNEGGTNDKTFGNLNQSRFNLVKLGQELHGPTNELFINRSQVVFREYLRDDSKVVEVIKNYK